MPSSWFAIAVAKSSSKEAITSKPLSTASCALAAVWLAVSKRSCQAIEHELSSTFALKLYSI